MLWHISILKRLLWLCLAIAPFGFATHQPAAAQDNTHSAGEEMILPFDPPLSQPLRYQVEIERIRSRGNTAYTLEQELTFEKAADGFFLELSTLSFASQGEFLDITDPATMDEIPLALRPFLLPMRVELDSAGEMIRMRNWAEMRGTLIALPELVAEMADAQEDREQTLRMARNIMGGFAKLTAEEAPAAMIRAWPDVLGYGGLGLADGDIYGAETDYSTGIFEAIITADVEISLTKMADGNLLLREVTTPNPDQFKAAVVEGFASLFDGQEGPKLEAAKAEMEAAKNVRMEDSLEITFDGARGHPMSAQISRKVSDGDGKASGQVMTINLVQ